MESKTERSRRGGDVRASRSKGCLTCRRRKVKCDERRPTCERCEKGARECLGYDKPLIFVHQGPQSDLSLRTTSTQPHYSSKSLASQGTRNATPATNESDSPPTSYNPAPGDVGHAGAAMNLSGFKDSIVIAHLIARFAFGYGDARPHGADAPTMVAILTSGNNESSAYLSGLGLAHAFFGRIHKDDEMVKGSVQLYGKALSSLRRDLQPSNQQAARSRAYMNLWTSILLGLYEMVSSLGPSNWLQHSSGVSALTQMAGPEAFQSDSANAMLELYRSFIVVGNIVHRKRCFLELPEWKSVPWQNRLKSASSQLCDVLCDMPGLMEDVDRVLAAEEIGEDMSVDRVVVQNKILDSIDELATLRWQWEASYPMACWERPIIPRRSISVDEYGHPLFESCLEYESVSRAIDIIHADAVRLLLYTLSDQIGLPDELLMSSLERNQRHGPGSTPLLLPGMGDRFANAMEICRSVEYLLEESRDSIGIFVLLFPMRVAFTHLQRVPKMAAWIQKILGSSTSKGSNWESMF